MGLILNAVIATIVVTFLGGGVAYLVWVKTRPKKETWTAKVYRLGDGIRDPEIKDGRVISDLKLQDLQPYALDVLEKVEKAPGITVFKLQKLNKATPAVEGDVVDYWGEGKKEVSVLIHKGQCTLLRRGYDQKTGEIIFDPLPHSRINLIKSEMAIRKDRLQKEKDIMQAITPWIVAGICMLGLVAIAYTMISGFVEIADKSSEAVTYNSDILLQIEQMKQGKVSINPNLGNQPKEQPSPTPPSIE